MGYIGTNKIFFGSGSTADKPINGRSLWFFAFNDNWRMILMKCCTFCSSEAEVLFNHLTHDIGSLCVECYMKLHGSCGVCRGSFLPEKVMPDVDYRIEIKFIGTGEKNFIVCNQCDLEIRQHFPLMFV